MPCPVYTIASVLPPVHSTDPDRLGSVVPLGTAHRVSVPIQCATDACLLSIESDLPLPQSLSASGRINKAAEMHSVKTSLSANIVSN
jgi:hypothetical protein